MKDYAKIITKINQTPWLITPEGLDIILKIVSERIENGRLDDEEIDNRLAGIGGSRRSSEDHLQVVNGVGILPVQGPIFGKANLMTRMSGATSLETFQQDLRAMLADDMVSSIIMEFDTPGGTSDLVEEVGNEIYAARSIKPIYASVNTMCGSAGLWLATQASKIYTTPSGSIGSLGVYTAHQDQSDADAREGIKFTYISAGQYKTEGNPHEALSAAAIQHFQETVDEIMDGFVGAVARGRGADPEYVRTEYGQGRMLTAKKAEEVGMTDGSMSFDQLLGNLIQNTPRKVSLVVGDHAPIAATMIGDTVSLSSDNVGDLRLATKVDGEYTLTEIVDIINKDRSIARKEENDMKLSAEALTKLGLKEDATDEQVEVALTAMHTELTELKPLKELKTSVESKVAFAEQFPAEHARMVNLEAANRTLNAKNFADSYKTTRFSDVKVEGEDGNKVITPTTKGLSGLALQTIEDNVSKLEDGTFTLADYKTSLDSILMGGIVDYGTKGTDVGVEPVEEDSVSASALENRTKFAAKIQEIQEKDKIDFDKAFKIAAEKHPKMYEAYKDPHVLKAA